MIKFSRPLASRNLSMGKSPFHLRPILFAGLKRTGFTGSKLEAHPHTITHGPLLNNVKERIE
jgi:hypothetical protein